MSDIDEAAALQALDLEEGNEPQDYSEGPVVDPNNPTTPVYPQQQQVQQQPIQQQQQVDPSQQVHPQFQQPANLPPQQVDPLAPVNQLQDPTIPLSALKDVVSSLQPQPQPQEPTQQEIDELYKVFTPDLEFAKTIFGEETTEQHVAGLQALTKGITDHIVQLIGASSRYLREEFTGNLAPMKEMHEREKTREFVGLLEQTYPTLKGQHTVINQAMQFLKSQPNYAPANGAQVGRDVAQVAAQIMKSANPHFNLLGPTTQQRPQQMATLQGGQGGGGSSTIQQNTGNYLNDIFD